MSNVIPIKLDDGHTFMAEVTPVELHEATPPARAARRRRGGEGVLFRGGAPETPDQPDEQTAEASSSMEKALETMKPVAQKIMSNMLALKPAEINVEFGIKVSGEAGIFVAKAGTDAHFKVQLKWTPGANSADEEATPASSEGRTGA